MYLSIKELLSRDNNSKKKLTRSRFMLLLQAILLKVVLIKKT